MIIKEIEPLIANHTLKITTDDGKVGVFDDRG
jgi:hypothetical protein